MAGKCKLSPKAKTITAASLKPDDRKERGGQKRVGPSEVSADQMAINNTKTPSLPHMHTLHSFIHSANIHHRVSLCLTLCWALGIKQ